MIPTARKGRLYALSTMRAGHRILLCSAWRKRQTTSVSRYTLAGNFSARNSSAHISMASSFARSRDRNVSTSVFTAFDGARRLAVPAPAFCCLMVESSIPSHASCEVSRCSSQA